MNYLRLGFIVLLSVFALGIGGIACNENNPPADNHQSKSVDAPETKTATADTQRPTPTPNPQARTNPVDAKTPDVVPVSDAPIPPADAQWTMICFTMNGIDHVNQSKKLKNDLVQSTGWKEWYIIHGEDTSTLYYGFYRTIRPEEKEGKDAQAKLDAVRKLTNRMNDPLFPKAGFVNIDAPDPQAPPQWDLAKLRHGFEDKEHYWSVQIAAYKDSPQRKQYAIDAVRAAREQGIEAYFYHGETTSSVCIGCWPMSAVKAQMTDKEIDKSSGEKPLFILPGELPKGAEVIPPKENGKTIDVDVLAPRTEIDDPTLKTAFEQYPYHATNGVDSHKVKDPRTGRESVVYDRSFLVVVPEGKSGGTFFGPSVEPGGMTQTQDQTQPRQQPVQPGQGRLRSVDGK